ncbi:polysaccharide pyruvyl transferase family protein [Anaerohalosphaeraceae bacterium U12dextr]
MKVALLTHHWVPNFGANLQALSSYLWFKKNNCYIEILNYQPRFLKEFYRKSIPYVQYNTHSNFCEQKLTLSPLLETEEEIVKYCEESPFDLIVSGSDSIFCLNKEGSTHEGAFPNPFWLQWVKNRLTYSCKSAILAGSCTGSMFLTFPKSLKQQIRKTIRSYDFISVRDHWTKYMFQFISRGAISPCLCPDPVSVLNDHLNCDNHSQSKYFLLSIPPRYSKIFSYLWIEEFVKAANAEGYHVFSLPLPSQELNYPVNKVIPLPLDSLMWYNWIRYSSGIISDRFHPILCALFNNVPFICIDNNAQKCMSLFYMRSRSKQYELTSMFGLSDRCFLERELFSLTPHKAITFLMQNEYYIHNDKIEKYKKCFNQCLNSILDLLPCS